VLERKPSWREVPPALRQAIADIMGAQPVDGRRAFGGYGPSATFRIRLGNGRWIFAKGAGPGSNAVNWRVVPREEAVYRRVGAIRAIAPTFYGSARCAGWHLLLLEDLGQRGRVPPWTGAAAAAVVRDVAAFHLRAGADLDELPPLDLSGLADNWRSMADDEDLMRAFLGLYPQRRTQAAAWVSRSLWRLQEAEAALGAPGQPLSIVHTDIRSDNLRLRAGHLVLFDWPGAARGPVALDPFAFFPSLAAEGGPSARELLPLYRAALRRDGMEVPAWAEAAAAAAVAGFFARRAGQPPIPGLPRLRWIQQRQLGPALETAAALLDLPSPPPLPPPAAP